MPGTLFVDRQIVSREQVWKVRMTHGSAIRRSVSLIMRFGSAGAAMTSVYDGSNRKCLSVVVSQAEM